MTVSSPPVESSPTWVDRETWPWPPRSVEIEGARLRYVDVGEGPTILFVHGTPTWSFDWRHLIRALSPSYRCVAVDHLGFGLSDRPVGADYTVEAHARRFAAFAEALDLRDVTLVVHDFGGPIALPLALERPGRVRRLVVTNTWMWPLDDDRGMRWAARFAGSALGRWMYKWLNASLRIITPSAYGDRRKLTPAIHAQYLAPFEDRQARVEVLWTLARALLASRDHYASLWERRAALAEVPTLIVWGVADSAFPPHFLDRWRQTLRHARVVPLARAGHWPHEEDPDAFLAALRTFLAA